MNQKRLEIASIMEKMGHAEIHTTSGLSSKSSLEEWQAIETRKEDAAVRRDQRRQGVIQIIQRIKDAEVVDGLTFMLRMKEDGSREERLVFETGATKLPFEGALEGPNGAVRVRADNPSTFVIAIVSAASDVGLTLHDTHAMLIKTATKFKEMCK
jgi:hypothetical protein